MNTEQLDNILEEFQKNSLEVTSSAIISVDGIMLASQLSTNVNSDSVAAMSAAVLSVSHRMIENLSNAQMKIADSVMVRSQFGYVIVTAITDSLLLTVTAKPDAKLGMVFHDIKQISGNVQDLGLAKV